MERMRMIMAATAAIGVVVLTPAALPAQGPAPSPAIQSDCAQPYEPWYSYADAYSLPTDGPSLGASVLVDTAKPDTDGDGTPDTIVDAGNGGSYEKMTITRGDGVITLIPGSHDYIYANSYSPPPGDLNGDGRDELIIGVDQQGAQYILPGTTSPATHAIDDVGIFTDNTVRNGRPVGDQNGDGADDMAFGDGTQIHIISGPDLMAPGPGGTIGALSTLTPLASYDGYTVAAAFLTQGQPATIITGRQGSGGSGAALTVHSDSPVELTAQADYTGMIGASTSDGATFITLASSNRSGSSFFVWNLTDPCSRYAGSGGSGGSGSPGTPAPAHPADAVDGSASYTG